MQFVATWLELEGVMLGEVDQKRDRRNDLSGLAYKKA